MEPSSLTPFLKKNLDILFIGLNPAIGSSRNKHYFSVNQLFWDQLYRSGLITKYVDKSCADDIIFGTNTYNLNHYNFGITDLITLIAESDSSKVKPSFEDCIVLLDTIKNFNPKIAIILHSKVLKYFFRFLNRPIPESNAGYLGELIPGTNTIFYSVAFPHGNAIPSDLKIKRYIEVKYKLLELKGEK